MTIIKVTSKYRILLSKMEEGFSLKIEMPVSKPITVIINDDVTDYIYTNKGEFKKMRLIPDEEINIYCDFIFWKDDDSLNYTHHLFNYLISREYGK